MGEPVVVQGKDAGWALGTANGNGKWVLRMLLLRTTTTVTNGDDHDDYGDDGY